MSWVAPNNDVIGWLLQCDTCGYIRGSLYARDCGMPRIDGKLMFRIAKTPSAWGYDGRTDTHTCPQCRRKIRGAT